MATARSNRSSSARESFSRYAASRCGRATALDRGVAARAARAHVHRPHELEPRREERVPADAGDRDDAVLERLAQRLEHRARELRQLVEQQDAAVRERDLAGPRARSASDHRGSRRAVVRRAKRRDGDERPFRGKQPRHGVDARHLQRLLAHERRQDPWQPPREHRLARSRWPLQEQVVGAGRRDLERSARRAPARGRLRGRAPLPGSSASSVSGAKPGASISPRK